MSGILYGDYLLENVSSLRDVTFTFSANVSGMRRKHRLTKLRGLVSPLEYVERLTLSSWCFKVLSESENLIRPLLNVKFLALSVLDVEHRRLVDFLACFPNLKMLVFKVEGFPEQDCSFIDNPLEPEEGLPTSSLSQLKTVEIRAPIDNPKTFQFIVFLLNRFSMLQKLVTRAYDEVDRCPPKFMYKDARLVLSLQRSFPTAEVILNL